MLQVNAGENDACAQIILAPNNSAGWSGNKKFLQAIALLSLAIAITCLLNGAPIVLFFSGLELLLLYFALRSVSRYCATRQVIELTPYEVIVQEGISEPEKQFRWQRLHTRVEIAESQSHGRQIAFSCRNQRILIGKFLTEREKNSLVTNLRSLVSHYRRHYL